jgi:hypothetical protein
MIRTSRLAALASAFGSLSAAAALAFLVSGASAAPAWGRSTPPCQPYSATANDAATSPAGPFVGIENITLGNTTYSDVPTVTTILAPLTPEGNSGVLTTTTSHAIALPSGTITTTDDAHLIPTQTPGVYKLVSHLVITGGATGELELQGTLNLGTLSAGNRRRHRLRTRLTPGTSSPALAPVGRDDLARRAQ